MSNGLPVAIDAERFVLGSVLDDNTLHVQAAQLEESDFSLEKHRLMWRRGGEVLARGERLDAMTLYAELARYQEADACDGLNYFNSLDEGLPRLPNIEGYVRIVKDRADLRRIVFTARDMAARAMSGEETPDEILSGAKETLVTMAGSRQESSLVPLSAIVEAAGGMTAYLDRSNRASGLSSGYPKLDRMTGGFQPGNFYIIGARPSMGKTAFAMNVADHVSVTNDAVTLVFSLEMDKQQLYDRMICSRARVDTKRFEGGWLNSLEKQKLARATSEIVEGGRILVDDKATTDMAEIHAKIRKEQTRRPVGLVIIDYLTLMIGGDIKARTAEASKISRDMKLVAKDCKLPLVSLAQLNRQCDERDDHRPKLSDLRETGSIEQDADVVMFMYRGEVYDDTREDLRGMADLIVAKQRNGPIGTVPLVWLKSFVKFESAADGEAPADWNER